MGWMILPEPGTKFGPCVPTCAHKDCAQTRAEAASVCHFCAKPIGYGAKCCRDGDDARLVHFACLLMAVRP